MIPHNGKGPRSGEGFPCRSVAEKETLDRLRFAAAKLIAVLRRSVATVHSMENCCVLFCFVIPLFQGHVCKTNEDPISVFKGPFMLKR